MLSAYHGFEGPLAQSFLTHERDIGEEEFRKMCQEAMRESIEKLLEGLPEDEPISPSHTHDILPGVERILCERHGFKRADVVEESYDMADLWYSGRMSEEPPFLSGDFKFLPEGLRREITQRAARWPEKAKHEAKRW